MRCWRAALRPMPSAKVDARHRHHAHAGRPARLWPGRRRAGDETGHRARQAARQLHHGAGQCAPPGTHRALRRNGGGRRAWCPSISSTCCRGPSSRPGAAATAASAPTLAASACRSKGREPFVLDFATSRVAQGKMRVAHNEGARWSPGYLIDEQGRPTDDPGVVVVPQAQRSLRRADDLRRAQGLRHGGGLRAAGRRAHRQRHWHRPADTARAVVNGMLTILIDPAEVGHASELRARGAGLRRLAQAKPAGAGLRWRADRGRTGARGASRAREATASRSTMRPGRRLLRRKRKRHCGLDPQSRYLRTPAWIPDRVRDDSARACAPRCSRLLLTRHYLFRLANQFGGLDLQGLRQSENGGDRRLILAKFDQ